MNKKMLNLFAIVVFGIAIIGCKNNTEETSKKNVETAMITIQDAAKYVVIVEESTIEWQGFKPTGSHKGQIKITNGEFFANDQGITKGSFTIDMSSINESENNGKLEGHLKSADFFDIANYPTAKFELTGLDLVEENTLMSGNLTVKDKTNKITFYVSLSSEGNEYTISSDTFKIDRSKWDVRYGSKSFFDDLKDKFINDDIELKITIKAKKA